MDVDEIRKLVRLMEEAGLTELEVEDRSGKIRLVRGAAPRTSRPRPADADADAAAADDADAPEPRGTWPGMRALDGVAQPAPAGADGGTLLTSPMVGTFYCAPAPDAEPFVHEGDVVHAGQVLCVIEAMKMMNEIHAEQDGRIVRTLAENGAPVEYGSPLFVVAPLE
jgi:acetyl-CoA carboxylase biotin carboxyl carrier protein